jgi:hypothetical protein
MEYTLSKLKGTNMVLNNLCVNKINTNVLILIFITHTTACFDQSDHLQATYAIIIESFD